MDIVDEARTPMAAATPGPWTVNTADKLTSVDAGDKQVALLQTRGLADAAFIAASPRLVAGFLAEMDAAGRCPQGTPSQTVFAWCALEARAERAERERDAAYQAIRAIAKVLMEEMGGRLPELLAATGATGTLST